MGTYYEIEMVRDERGVWVAPWEIAQAWTAADVQAAPAAAQPATDSPQEKHSWGEFLYSLLPGWKDRSEHFGQQAA